MKTRICGAELAPTFAVANHPLGVVEEKLFRDGLGYVLLYRNELLGKPEALGSIFRDHL